MTNGRKPQPTRLKEIKGERPSRMPQHEPQPKPTLDVPKPPAWMPLEAQKVWRDVAPDLHRTGVLTPWDLPAFEAYCNTIANLRAAQKLVDEEGVLVIGERGTKIKHPGMQVVRDLTQSLVRLAGEFGLTPSSRAHIEIAPATEDEAKRLLS